MSNKVVNLPINTILSFSINLLAIDAAKCVFPTPDSPIIISPLVSALVIFLFA